MGVECQDVRTQDYCRPVGSVATWTILSWPAHSLTGVMDGGALVVTQAFLPKNKKKL